MLLSAHVSVRTNWSIALVWSCLNGIMETLVGPNRFWAVAKIYFFNYSSRLIVCLPFPGVIALSEHSIMLVPLGLWSAWCLWFSDVHIFIHFVCHAPHMPRATLESMSLSEWNIYCGGLFVWGKTVASSSLICFNSSLTFFRWTCFCLQMMMLHISLIDVNLAAFPFHLLCSHIFWVFGWVDVNVFLYSANNLRMAD